MKTHKASNPVITFDHKRYSLFTSLSLPLDPSNSTSSSFSLPFLFSIFPRAEVLFYFICSVTVPLIIKLLFSFEVRSRSIQCFLLFNVSFLHLLTNH
jgi:hypothetical protein